MRVLWLLGVGCVCCGAVLAQGAEPPPVVLVVHGGAGVDRETLTPEREQAARAVLAQALAAGQAVLTAGGSSVGAVEAALVVMEDAPEFNAGRGAVLNARGAVEMDASIMDGHTRRAGAVAAVTTVRNPIRLARLVMTETPHVLLVGEGAEALGREHGLRFEAPDWFVTPRQRERLEQAQRRPEAAVARPDPVAGIGTVGAVALDRQGHLAAGTSTGGLVNKRPGRVGDSPLIGAGTYAEDGVCAVSCTGQGEYFIRLVVAHEVAARIKHAKAELADAVAGVIHAELPKLGGSGGLIGLDPRGRMCAVFNTDGMFHGWVTADGATHVAVFEPTPPRPGAAKPDDER